ncbi:MAG: lipoyl(octanoyl) transferase LipB [Sedimentisphaerales bacterium]|jgi:lipoate-protein ligase B
MSSGLQTLEQKMTARSTLQVHDCGLTDYRTVLEMQLALRAERQQNEIPDTVLLVEHPPVITLGARQSRNKLLVSRGNLTRNGIDVVDVRRGGGTTAHNPGQVVIYPVLHLPSLGLCISDYVRKLELIGLELLRQLGVESARKPGSPGLWVEDRKIASVGVRVSRLTTYHGMAINIHNDLSIFDSIVPCGIDNVEMTSVLKETGNRPSMTEVKERLTPLLRAHLSGGK